MPITGNEEQECPQAHETEQEGDEGVEEVADLEVQQLTALPVEVAGFDPF
jgi:hypothetical protein